jgi:hypothetical protein
MPVATGLGTTSEDGLTAQCAIVLNDPHVIDFRIELTGSEFDGSPAQQSLSRVAG